MDQKTTVSEPNKTIYLIPTRHEYQWNAELPETNELSAKLIELVHKFSIDFIGEEFSTDALNLSGHLSVAQNVAEKFNINHEFCDPDEITRKKIGYPIQSDLRTRFGIRSSHEGTVESVARKKYEKLFFYIRENYWLDQINKAGTKNIIFICGREHVENFTTKLLESGYSVLIT